MPPERGQIIGRANWKVIEPGSSRLDPLLTSCARCRLDMSSSADSRLSTGRMEQVGVVAASTRKLLPTLQPTITTSPFTKQRYAPLKLLCRPFCRMADPITCQQLLTRLGRSRTDSTMADQPYNRLPSAGSRTPKTRCCPTYTRHHHF